VYVPAFSVSAEIDAFPEAASNSFLPRELNPEPWAGLWRTSYLTWYGGDPGGHELVLGPVARLKRPILTSKLDPKAGHVTFAHRIYHIHAVDPGYSVRGWNT